MHVAGAAFSRTVASCLIACVLGAGGGAALGQATSQHQVGHASHVTGNVHFPVSCTPQAQAKFDEAVTLLHHMTYPQARTAFEQTAVTDPACAMAHWGIAMTLFQPLWPTRPTPSELVRGWEATQKAKALAPPTMRERRFVEAAEAFFFDPGATDYWLRIRR